MKLAAVVENYIRFKRALGMRLRSEAAALRSFSRTMGSIDVAAVKPGAVRAFIVGRGPVTARCKQYFSVLSSFYRYVLGRGFANTSPLPATLPRIPPPGPPYIYTHNDLKRLLAATAILQTPQSPWRGQAFRALLLLLYGTGLRIGEALSLTLRDVDLDNRVITVRSGKFFKYAGVRAMWVRAAANCADTINPCIRATRDAHARGIVIGHREMSEAYRAPDTDPPCYCEV